jgi:nucleoside-diphosphate-sugar epimerase
MQAKNELQALISDYYRNKRCLVIGGAGFIGSNLVHELVRLSSEVLVADTFHPDYGSNWHNLENVKSKISFSYTDLRDEFGIRQLIQKVDVIFNLAAQVSYTDSMKIPLDDLDVNCRGHLQFLETCRRHNPSASLVFTSSRMVYGNPQRIPVDEDHPTNPLSLYAVHKLTGEKYYYIYNHFYDLNTKWVRIANPYGPRNQMRHSKYGIVNWFIRMAMENKDIKIFGDGKQMRDYIYVEDLVMGLLRVGMIEKDYTDRCFNLGTAKGTSFREMVDTVIRVVAQGRKVEVPWPKDYEKNETGDFVANIDRLQRLFGGHYKFISLENGIRETHEFYLTHQNNYF